MSTDDEVVYLNDKLELVLHDVKLDSKQVIMPNDTFVSYRVALTPSYFYLFPVFLIGKKSGYNGPFICGYPSQKPIMKRTNCV